jgi:flagellar biosynthesis protein
MYNYKNFQKGQKAVALGYEDKKDIAPKILATGNGAIAQQIFNIAKSNNIPIHQDADLVQILSVLEIDSYIPLEVYGAVAEILSYIYKQNNLAKQNKLKK